MLQSVPIIKKLEIQVTQNNDTNKITKNTVSKKIFYDIKKTMYEYNKTFLNIYIYMYYDLYFICA